MDENQVKQRMNGSIEVMQKELAGIRTGRATPSLVEDIVVAAYGGAQKLKIMELASITAPDTQSLVIEPWDKSIIGEIKQGILASNVGLTPNIDSDKIRINLPPLTGEDRQKYVKLLGTKLEDAKIAIRQIRGDVMGDIKKAFESKDITEDQRFSQEKRLQALTDESVKKIEELGKKKEEELLSL